MSAVADEIFSDEVFTATELNRRVGTVLDHARVHPVTISRNTEQFALLPREQAAKLFRTVSQMRSALALLSEAHRAIGGDEVSPEFSWLTVFDQDDLNRLISELLASVRGPAAGMGDWSASENLIYEWRESALVAQSRVLDSAMCLGGDDECPLMDPRGVVTAVEENTTAECRK